MGTKQDKIEQAFTAGFEDKNVSDADLEDTTTAAAAAADSTNLEVADPAVADPAVTDPAVTDPAPAADEWEGVPTALKDRFEDLTAQLAKVTNIANSASGRANKLQGDLDKQLKAKPVEKPALTSEQLLAAMTNTESRDKLREDFGEFAAALDEIDNSVSTSVGSAIDNLRSELLQQTIASSDQARADFETKRTLDIKHPGWENTVQQEEFKVWTYEGGPTEQERLYYESLMAHANQAAPEDQPAAYDQANTYYQSLIVNHPVWADEKGTLFGNPSGEAAITLLDLYEKEKAPAPAAKAPVATTNAFEENLAPTSGKGQQAPAAPTEDVEKAFSEGFNS
tara:strand:+ start:31707 stop:32723 length:1017 start_codon:yes stop_codon:yes gene_type:complete